jgi:hypothetical protein
MDINTVDSYADTNASEKSVYIFSPEDGNRMLLRNMAFDTVWISK